MNDLAKAYGGALYELAREEQLEELLLSQLDTVDAVFRENPEYLRLMDSRALPKAERLALLDTAFTGKVHPYLVNFMKILCERGAFSQFSMCREAYVGGYNEQHGIVLATAVSASALSQEQTQRLVRALEKKTGKTVRLTVKVDPSLGGGLRVQMGGYRFDNTVISRMDTLRRALLAQS